MLLLVLRGPEKEMFVRMSVGKCLGETNQKLEALKTLRLDVYRVAFCGRLIYVKTLELC